MAKRSKTKLILLPFYFLYKFGVVLRNKLFDWKILPVEEFSIPVISIGNITVGGTGKTPHTEYLIQLLSKKRQIAVLSRGYKRKTKGFVLADEHANSYTIGDEPFQIYRKFPEIQVAVDGNRRRGIRELLSLDDDRRPEIILLDDAFQHRYVKPSLSILLIDSNKPIYEDSLLPIGRLRESPDGKSRAQIIIVTKCSEKLKSIDYRIITKRLNLYPYQDLFFTSIVYGDLIPVFDCEAKQNSLENLTNNSTSALILAGVASPDDLIKKIKTHVGHTETLIFPDHHHFSTKDIRNISTSFDSMPEGDKLIITTEKDAVRLLDCAQDLHEFYKNCMYYLPIKISFNLEQESIFNQKIEEHVRNVKRDRGLA